MWLVLLLDVVMLFTYRDRRSAYLRALGAAESVRKLADEMALVFESVHDGVMVTSSGTVTRVNETMAEQLGLDLSDVVGRRMVDVVGTAGDALPILPYTGSHMVWLGAVPDYTMPEARRIRVRESVARGAGSPIWPPVICRVQAE